jgi:hypothetical protein
MSSLYRQSWLHACRQLRALQSSSFASVFWGDPFDQITFHQILLNQMLLKRQAPHRLLDAKQPNPAITSRSSWPRVVPASTLQHAAHRPKHGVTLMAASATPALTVVQTSSVDADASNRALYLALAYMSFSTTHELDKIMELMNPGRFILTKPLALARLPDDDTLP